MSSLLAEVDAVEGQEERKEFKMPLKSGAVATICFSETDTDEDVKGYIRDVLTSAYEERINAMIMGTGDAG